MDAGESESKIRNWSNSNGFSWPMAAYNRDANQDYQITYQAIAVAMDANGIIVDRGGFSGSDKWRELFEELLAG